MFDRLQQSLNTVASRLSRARYRTAASLKRLARAWGYFTGRLGEDDAQRIMLDCRNAAGWYPLLILTVEDTLQEARETFVDHPELPRLIADGCAGVAHKWESHNDELYTARGWAMGLALRYAADEGITLRRLSEEGDEVKAASS
jgi:phage tail sheath protein FI